MILLKPVFIIAIVAVAMIGVMVPSGFAESEFIAEIENVIITESEGSKILTVEAVIKNSGDEAGRAGFFLQDSTLRLFEGMSNNECVNWSGNQKVNPEITRRITACFEIPNESDLDFTFIVSNYFNYAIADYAISNFYPLNIPSNSTPTAISEPITVHEPTPEPTPEPTLAITSLGIASFVDQTKDPQHYIDRYNNESSYKKWFDENYSQYLSIYEAVGLEEPLGIASFVDTSKDPQSYVDRYNNESSYKQWFNDNYSQYSSIYEAVGMEKPIVEPISEPVLEPDVEYTPELITEVISTPNCGTGTIEQDGICVVELKNTSKIKLIPGQWAEYDVSLEFEGSRTMIAMMDKKMKESTTDTGYDIFKVTKLRVEVLEVTDTFVEIERTITMIDDEITNIQKIDDVSGGTFFAQPFIELPHPSTLKQNLDDSNPFTIKSINFKGEKNLTVNKQKISALFYRGYTSSHLGEDTPSKSDDLNSQTSLAEYYFEKNTGILVKSKNEITIFGIVPFLGEVDIKMMLIMSMTDDYIPKEKSSNGGGCLIATATYGSEMALEVQQLRELRDNQLLQTESGTAFMSTFNDIYYSFSPTIADMEREHPMFKEAVKLAITPMITSLSLMENAETESEVLSIGISVIVLNLGMYLGIPAVVIIGIRKIK
jgi:hypothetical protein